jgi:hypothetical protein
VNALTHSTIVCALIHYSLHVSDPTFCIEALDEINPGPAQPWADSIAEARRGYRDLLARTEAVSA